MERSLPAGCKEIAFIWHHAHHLSIPREALGSTFPTEPHPEYEFSWSYTELTRRAMRPCSLHRRAHEHLDERPKRGCFHRAGHRLLHKPHEGSLPLALATPREDRKWVRRQIRWMDLGPPPTPMQGSRGDTGRGW